MNSPSVETAHTSPKKLLSGLAELLELDSHELVRQGFMYILNRLPTPGGVQHFASQLESGLAPEIFLLVLMLCPENQGRLLRLVKQSNCEGRLREFCLNSLEGLDAGISPSTRRTDMRGGAWDGAEAKVFTKSQFPILIHDDSTLVGKTLPGRTNRWGNETEKSLGKRYVRVEVVDETCVDIDAFMTSGEVDRSWQPFELTQSHDVRRWIDNPIEIDGLQQVLSDLCKRLGVLARPVRILDVGCYGGYVYDYLSKYAFKSEEEFRYTGIDIQELAIRGARAAHANRKNVSFDVGDIYSLAENFPADSFDVVICYRVLIHIPYLEECVRNLTSVASRFVHSAVWLKEAPYCRKCLETDLMTENAVTYFHRFYAKEELRHAALNCGTNVEIVCNSSSPYSTVVFGKVPLKLNFGCGSTAMKGYDGVDIRPLPGLRYCCQAWEIEKHVAAGSVEAVYSRHFFEHLSFLQAHLTLGAWKNILSPGGTLQIVVPDLRFHVEQYLIRTGRSEANPEWTNLEHALAGFWGWQREAETETWDIHKSGYDFFMLEDKLREFGFEHIERQEDDAWNLNIKCVKPRR